MSELTETSSAPRAGLLIRLAKALALTLLILVMGVFAAIVVFQQTSDGPYGPLQGGAFETGQTVTDRITDWSFLSPEDIGEIEFELERYAQAQRAEMDRNGRLRIPPDPSARKSCGAAKSPILPIMP